MRWLACRCGIDEEACHVDDELDRIVHVSDTVQVPQIKSAWAAGSFTITPSPDVDAVASPMEDAMKYFAIEFDKASTGSGISTSDGDTSSDNSKDDSFEGFVATSRLEETWASKTDCHMHGIMTEGQSFTAEREFVSFGSTKLLGERPPVVACQKGNKGYAPNQDNYSITYFKNGYTLACVFDGHGHFGHNVATRTAQTVPYFLIHNAFFATDVDAPSRYVWTQRAVETMPSEMATQLGSPRAGRSLTDAELGMLPGGAQRAIGRGMISSPDPEVALIEAFEQAHADVVAFALKEEWDITGSGTTGVAALWKGDKVWTANCGDSRCVTCALGKKTVVHATRDHKADSPTEKQRIEASGGEVRSRTFDDGFVTHRVYVKGEKYPGLAMTRSIGDDSAKSAGVIATPETESFEVDFTKKPFLLLATDGVWDFLNSEVVAHQLVNRFRNNRKWDCCTEAVEALQDLARDRWDEEEGDYCDDITSVLVPLW